MNAATRRRAKALVLVIGMLMLPGCSSLGPTAAGPTDTSKPRAGATDPATEAVPTATSTPTQRRTPADLSFETGVDLDPTTRVQWFNTGNDFSELSPDDGKGNWALTDKASKCKIYFFQGTIRGLDYNQDDRTVTDDLLWLGVKVTVKGSTRDDVTKNAFDDAVPLLTESGTVPVRTIWISGTDQSSWLYSARIFASIRGVVSINIICPAGQNADKVYARLRDEKAIVLDVGPSH